MTKKIGYILGLLPQLLLVAGAYIVQYYTGKKMGMARHVIFKNQEWEKAYPLEQWKLISIILLVLLLAAVLAILIRRRRLLTSCLLAESVITVYLTMFSLYFTLANSAATLRPYYWMSPMFASAALLQIGRLFILLVRRT